MILIADSGSTKTDWRIIDGEDNVYQAKSKGFNPNYVKADDIRDIIKAGLAEHLDKPVTEIYFYGSGCSTDVNKKVIVDAMQPLFPDAVIESNHDMLAAARALCGKQRGIACILGTGSNSGLYDGESIIENVMSLGYLLGDEGSGNVLGKRLLVNYFKGRLPEAVKSNFNKRFEMSDPEIIEALYKNESPVRFLASFAKFVSQNIKDPFMYKMVYDVFDEFFEENVMKYTGYKNEPVHFVGSVAFYFSNILRQVGADKGINIQHIVEGPIAGLALYHQGKA